MPARFWSGKTGALPVQIRGNQEQPAIFKWRKWTNPRPAGPLWAGLWIPGPGKVEPADYGLQNRCSPSGGLGQPAGLARFSVVKAIPGTLGPAFVPGGVTDRPGKRRKRGSGAACCRGLGDAPPRADRSTWGLLARFCWWRGAFPAGNRQPPMLERGKRLKTAQGARLLRVGCWRFHPATLGAPWALPDLGNPARWRP